MNFKRKCVANRIASLFAAASMLLTVSPGITASADYAAFSEESASAPNLSNDAPSADNDAATGSDLIITAADGGEELQPGTDYDYNVNDVTATYSSVTYKIGELKIKTSRKVEIKNADGVDSTMDYIVAANPNGCSIVLAGVNISRNYVGKEISSLKVEGDADANIILKDGTENYLKAADGCGIEKNGTGTLYIACEKAGEIGHKCDDKCGKLEVISAYEDAAIGTTNQSDNTVKAVAQNIHIAGGNIKAKSGFGTDSPVGGDDAIGGGAAIGGGEKSAATNITITGGIIYAEVYSKAAAIGGGGYANADTTKITISGANVTAIALRDGAAIGSGVSLSTSIGNCDGVTITDSFIKCEVNQAAAIGGGGFGKGSNITIQDCIVSIGGVPFSNGDAIGNGIGKYSSSFGEASNIIISRSSVKMSIDFQQSPIMNGATDHEQVYLLSIDNPKGAKIYVDGSEVITKGYNNTAVDPNDTNVYLWLTKGIIQTEGEDPKHDIELIAADGTSTKYTYHFNPDYRMGMSTNAFWPCKVDTSRYHAVRDEIGHWSPCSGSKTCKVRYEYEAHNLLLGYDDEYHWDFCTICDAEFAYEPHADHLTKVPEKAATCTEYGSIEYFECECGMRFADENAKTKIKYSALRTEPTGHTWSEEFESDRTGHWHGCINCDAVNGFEKHTSSGAATPDKAEVCTVCGYEIAPATGYVAAPVISPNGGTFRGRQTVTITCATDGAEIYYTTDGTEPTTASTKYTGEFTITTDATVKAIAVKSGMGDSTVATAAFKKKSSSGGYNNSRPSQPTTPNDSNPSINGTQKSWAEIAAELEKLPLGSEVTIDLNGSYKVPAEVIKAISDGNIKATFAASSRSWVVDGAKISAASAADFSAVLGNADKSALRGVLGTDIKINDIGVPADLKLTFRKEFAGQFANLYKLTDGKLVFRSCAKIDANGVALVPNVNAQGEYIVMVCEFSDLRGDMSNDGVLSVLDASAILKKVICNESGANPLMADFNGDGEVDLRDALEVLKLTFGVA